MSKKYIAIRYWDDMDGEEDLGEFATEAEAQKCIDADFEDYGSAVFLREHVMYKIIEVESK